MLSRRATVDGQDGILRRVGDDLRAGRNVELYLTVTLSLCIAVLSIFAIVDIRVVGAATLAVLALLAASGLTTRYHSALLRAHLDQITADLSGDVPADRFLKARMPTLDREFAAATDIRLVGVTLARTVRDLLPVLDRRLRHGATVRVLVIDADSPAQQQALARSLGADRPDLYRHRIASTIDLLGVLATAAPQQSQLQLRVLPYVPAFGMCLVDPGQPHGRIHVEIYQHHTIEQEPSFSLNTHRDGPWYEHFLNQFEVLWASGRPHSLSAPD
jgi:hypothetical protein